MAKRPFQLNVQIDDELREDMAIVAKRRGQTISELVRRAIEDELQREADTYVEEM